jgi:hypothetical protein
VKNQKNYGVVRFEEPWGNKTIIKYKVSEKGPAIFQEILESYEVLLCSPTLMSLMDSLGVSRQSPAMTNPQSEGIS